MIRTRRRHRGARLGVLLAVATVLAGAGLASAQPAGYTARERIGLFEQTGSTLSQYQVRLVIDTASLIAAGTMRADGADMVFTTADCNFTVVPHWVEFGINSAATVVWVKVPSLPGGQVTKLLMWHGNPTATSTSSARMVFIGAANGDPLSSTNQVSGGTSGGVANSQRGFRFRPNVDVLVMEFGKNEPNGSTRWVTLFDSQTQAILRQQQVSGPASTYTYAPLTQPLWLTAGREYTLQLFQGGSDGYFYGTSSQIASDLTYLDMRYCNGCNQNTFPTMALTNYHYGYPDLRYYKRQVAALEPGQVATASDCTESATCDSDCTAPMCGDGVANMAAGEECDDGNGVDTDKCLTTCQDAACGDGFVYIGVEQCDDGNQNETDGCHNDCTLAGCGDGVVQAATEQCDDGNQDNTDGCLATCQTARCGDGFVQAGVEQCDDGNTDDGDGCAGDCSGVGCQGAECDGGGSPGGCCAVGPERGGGGGRELGGMIALALVVAGAITRRRRRRRR